MSEEHTLKKYLGKEFQTKLLWQLVTEPEFAEKTIPLLEVAYWDDATYKRFFYILSQHLAEYTKPANLQNNSVYQAIRNFNKVTNTTEIELLDAVADQLKNWNNRVINHELEHDGDDIQKDTINFIKQQEYRKVSDFIQSNIKQGEHGGSFLFDIETKLKVISQIGNDEDMGIEIMENVGRALRKEFRKPIPTGIAAIDLLTKGGLGNGEIGIILAPSGVGKSTILSYIANTGYNNGYNVLQIIFEDNEDDIRRKHYAKWSGIPLSEMDDRLEEVNERINDWHKNNKFGTLRIKKFSQEDTTMPRVRQYVENYRKKFGIRFDLIVLDYIDVLEPHKRSTDQNASELQIIKSFEGMAHELDIPCWTAIQTNRTGFGAELVDTSQMGGNIKRAQKTHFLMSVAKTQEQKLIGQANIAILKARMAQDGHVFRDCRFNNNTMEIMITDDIIPASSRAELQTKTITDEQISDFHATMAAKSENQELDPHKHVNDVKDGIEDVQIINDTEDVYETMHTSEKLSDDKISEIDRLLLERTKNQDVMKNK